jgi:hypothetical protein
MSQQEREIKAFLAKKSKAAIVLEMLLNREYVTASDIINYRDSDTPVLFYDKNGNPQYPVFTTCPHKLVEIIRKRFGYDLVKDNDIPFFRIQYSSKGKMFKISDTYKKYFLDKLVGG